MNKAEAKKYDRSGRFAAEHDFKNFGKDHVLARVTEAFKLMTWSINSHHSCESDRYVLNYIQAGLVCLNQHQIAELVKTNFSEAAKLFINKIHTL